MYGSINVFIWNCNRCRFGNWFVARSQVCGPLYRWGVRRVMGARIIRVALVAVLLSLSARKTAREYFNIWYKPEHRTEFCRAHLVGKVFMKK